MLDQGEEESRVGNRGVVRAARIDERRIDEWGTAEGGGVMRLRRDRGVRALGSPRMINCVS
jgi:hypothetical protein